MAVSWQTLTAFTDEAQAAALAKCSELGYDTKRGEIPLDEAYINLRSSVQLLTDAAEKGALEELPLSVQKVLSGQLTSIEAAQTSLANGSDQVVNLVNAVEALYATIWQYGLHRLTPEILGLERKINQLKHEEVALAELRRELRLGLKTKEGLDRLVISAEASAKEARSQADLTATAATNTTALLQEVTDAKAKAADSLATTIRVEKETSQHAADAQASATTVQALEKQIRTFHSEIVDHQTKLSQIQADASAAVDRNQQDTTALVEQLRTLEGQIKQQMEKATGYTLFHSFQKRQEALQKGKRLWIAALAALVAASIGLSAYVISTSQGHADMALYLKLSMSIPLIYAITFCTVQYSRERRLEEEYAFKSNISISLDPYQTLVQRLLVNDDPAERAKFTGFLVDAITKVFTSPTEHVFAQESGTSITPESMKAVAKILEQLKALLPK